MKRFFLVMAAVVMMTGAGTVFAQRGPCNGRGPMRAGQVVRNCPDPECPNRANCPNRENCPNPNCPRRAQKPPAPPAK